MIVFPSSSRGQSDHVTEEERKEKTHNKSLEYVGLHLCDVEWWEIPVF